MFHSSKAVGDLSHDLLLLFWFLWRLTYALKTDSLLLFILLEGYLWLSIFIWDILDINVYAFLKHVFLAFWFLSRTFSHFTFLLSAFLYHLVSKCRLFECWFVLLRTTPFHIIQHFHRGVKHQRLIDSLFIAQVLSVLLEYDLSVQLLILWFAYTVSWSVLVFPSSFLFIIRV